MPQSADIVLNGDPYMLAPGKSRGGYTRTQDGIDEGRTGRVSQTDFFGGTRRPYQLENDRGWDSTLVGPVYGGQGVHPWPFLETRAMGGSDPLFSATDPYPSLVLRDYVYVGLGQYLYRTAAISAGTWSTPTQVYDAGSGNVITGLCYYGGNMLIAFGPTKDITHVLYPDATSPAVLFTGERGTHIVSYQGFALWNDERTVSYPNAIRLVTGSGIDTRYIDSPTTRMALAQSDVVIASSAAVYAFRGRVGQVTAANPSPPPDYTEFDRWVGDMTPFFQHGTATATDDYRFIVGFGGRTYAWVGKTVMEHDPQGDRAGWKDAGLTGQECYGACVAAGYLVVSIKSTQGRYQVWAFDGSGWWKLADSASTQWVQPIPLAGVGAYDVMVPAAGSRNLHCYRLVPRSTTLHAYPSTAGASQYVTSLIDAGERDKLKAWRKVGAVFAAPEEVGNAASSDEVTIIFQYSVDGGATWVSLPGTALGGSTMPNHNFVLDGPVASDVAVSRFLQIRVTYVGVSDWAPVLVGLWAEYELLDSPARRRRWSFTVIAQDQVIDRDGETLTRTGREQIAELWQHWQAGTTVPFRDLDYDSDPVERRVRIVGIEERVDAPHQAGHWGDSVVMLTLVEV
jgi:hypothetical protein